MVCSVVSVAVTLTFFFFDCSLQMSRHVHPDIYDTKHPNILTVKTFLSLWCSFPYKVCSYLIVGKSTFDQVKRVQKKMRNLISKLGIHLGCLSNWVKSFYFTVINVPCLERCFTDSRTCRLQEITYTNSDIDVFLMLFMNGTHVGPKVWNNRKNWNEIKKINT